MNQNVDFILSAEFPTSPRTLYRAWIDGAGHAEMTGASATSDPRVDGEFTAWDGYISGVWLELEPDRHLTMRWRTVQFPKTAPSARVRVVFDPTPGGTRLTLTQEGTPPEQVESYRRGWDEHYFEPIRVWLAESGV